MEDRNSSYLPTTFIDLLKEFPNPSPAFRIWILKIIREGGLKDTVTAIMKAGLAESEEEAVLWLCNEVERVVPKNPSLVVSDVWTPTKRKNILLQLKSLVRGEEKTSRQMLALLYGIAGHVVIPDLFSGRFDDHKRKKAQAMQSFDGKGKQLELFAESSVDGEERVCENEQQLALFPVTQKTSIIRPTVQELRDIPSAIRRAWKKLLPLAEGEIATVDLYRHHAEAERLYKSLSQVFGEQNVRKIRRGSSSLEDYYLSLLTAMTWATAFLYYRKENRRRILFREVPVLGKQHGFPGGRIDAIEVRRINGRPLNKRQKRILDGMTKLRFQSAGDLLYRLEQAFGEFGRKAKIEIAIIDWKFSIGDGDVKILHPKDGGAKISCKAINSADIENGPLAKHFEQLIRYLTLANLDYRGHLVEKRKNHWSEDTSFSYGEVVYFLPSGLPIVHRVTVTSEDQRSFLKQIASNLSSSQRRAVIRLCDQRILGGLVRQLEGGKNNNHLVSRLRENKKAPQQSFWEERGKEVGAVRRLIEEEREFVDPETRIIEVVGKNQKGESKYTMRFDRLLTAIEGGVLVTSNFSFHSGGFIRCLASEHSDPGPSLHIWLKALVFKCFGCGLGGTIDPVSISQNLSLPIIRSTSWARRAFSQTISYRGPDEKHVRIMLAAQEILQRSFKKSEAERYIRKERRLDPDLAFQMGAGFGNDELINGLMDAGYTLDDLVFYGFVDFSARMNPSRGISPLLTRRGFSELEARREVDRKSGEPISGFPFSVLASRITFPLGMRGFVDNFYGRHINLEAGKYLRHRKLSIEHTGVPHGAFNAKVLDSDSPEVGVVEGVMDALTLIESGYTQTLAMIGIDNAFVLEEIVRSEKVIAIGLDNDEAGWLKTAKLLERFDSRGKADNICLLTASFAEHHPEMKEGMDWNDWWQKYGRRKKNKI